MAVAVAGAALFVASIPFYFERVKSLSGFGMYAKASPGAVRAALDAIGVPVGLYAAYSVAFVIALALAFWAVGVVIFWRRSNGWWGLFLSLVLVTLGSTAGGTYYALSQVHPGLAWLASFGDIIGNFGFVSFWLLLYLFPDGRFVPRWTRWVSAFYVAYIMVDWVFPNSPYNLDNRGLLGAPIMIVVVGTMVYAQVFRYRRVSGPTERQQTKWVAFGFAMATVGFFGLGYAPFLFLSPGNPGVADVIYELVANTAVGLLFLLVPLSIGAAILRYRLWGIDLIINRTLVYGALTACVVGLYVLVVGALGAILQSQGSVFVSLLATGMVAVVFAPLRDRLQRAVNRLMYGERDDPYKVLSGLGERLEATLAPGAVLPTIVEAIAEALKLPYAAITLEHEGKRLTETAEYGQRQAAEDPLVVSLVYQRETVGELVLAPRAPGEAFNRSDHRLLHDISRQIGVAAHDVRLTADLQRSRERLVTAREEERRRLRRDLHDGVGPRLAALMLELETAGDLVSGNPEASALIAKLSERAREAVADVRRSVHALRPPALDELGLVGALRETALGYARGNLRMSVETSEELPTLPAAVEVACYRIAQEAMTNVVRHAGAANCRVLVVLDEGAGVLRLEVEDDGRGILEEDGVGVGMSSMRERAEELGGSCTVGPSERRGTLVSALLPCRSIEETDRGEE